MEDPLLPSLKSSAILSSKTLSSPLMSVPSVPKRSELKRFFSEDHSSFTAESPNFYAGSLDEFYSPPLRTEKVDPNQGHFTQVETHYFVDENQSQESHFWRQCLACFWSL